ncbi:MAG: adenylate cyclase [Streptomyces sp.]|nr:adenylate cyclase [Streptomyces sp.]
MKLLKRAAVAVASAALVTGAAGIAAGPAFATGQPGKTCLQQDATSEPGNASSARGSAFNENGGVAGGVYAGSDGTHSLANANSPNAVSQYDVACYQVTQHAS